eukprot:g25288.t1
MSVISEFRSFIAKGNVVDLAVGIIIGGAFTGIVQSLVNDIVMPIVGALTGGGFDFKNYFLPLSSAVTAPSLEEARKQGAVFAYGSFITVFINFLILAFIIFLMVKAVNKLRQLEHKKPEEAQPTPPPADETVMSLLASLSSRALAAPESGIVEIINHARGREDLIPLWAGEGDLPSPDFINRAATEALLDGETFYTWQRGIPELRQALSDYYIRHFSVARPAEDFFVTGSGMHAIMLAVQAITSPGDEMIYLSPTWPNIVSAIEISGAVATALPLQFVGGRWSLDLARLEGGITSKTKGLFINTPSNPTGWTASRDDLRDILALARKHGLWIIADEIYARYFYGAAPRAASFLDVCDNDDRIIFANSFSKNWSMTGWRVGWLVAPAALGQVIENLVQYSNSGVAQFLQRGAVVALNQGDAFVEANIERAAKSRDILCDALIATNRVQTLKPEGALYAFVKVDGITDSRQAALDIVDRIGVALAPGSAFGPGGENFLRACFLRDPAHVQEAANRLAAYIQAL